MGHADSPGERGNQRGERMLCMPEEQQGGQRGRLLRNMGRISGKEARDFVFYM